MFTLFQQQEVPSTCLPRNLPCFVFEPLYLTVKWPTTLFVFSTLLTTPIAHPVEKLRAINRPFSVFMLTTDKSRSRLETEIVSDRKFKMLENRKNVSSVPQWTIQCDKRSWFNTRITVSLGNERLCLPSFSPSFGSLVLDSGAATSDDLAMRNAGFERRHNVRAHPATCACKTLWGGTEAHIRGLRYRGPL